MATYTTRIYRNTGFNAINIPDSPDLLDRCDYKDVDNLVLLQQRFLTSVRIRAEWADVKDCDYVKVGSMYYSVTGVAMTSADVAELSIVPDFITSAGGVANLEFLDGITQRVHVSDDSYGRYCMEDPLMIPEEPLQVELKWKNPEEGYDMHTYVETTIDLPKTGARFTAHKYVTEDPEPSEVVVPSAYYLDNEILFNTEYKIGDHTCPSPKTTIFDLDSDYFTSASDTKKGIQRCRDLGIENGIFNQVQISKAYAEATHTIGYGSSDWTGEAIAEMTGKEGTIDSNISFRYTNARNNRLNYGSYTPYGIITASGESCTFNPEELLDPQNPNTPVIKFIGDPRLDGKPYFRFKVVDGDSSDEGFFRNCVSGLPWKQVPLVFNSVSGSALNTLKYENSRSVSSTAFDQSLHAQARGMATQQMASNASYILSLGSGIASGLAGLATGNIAQANSGINNAITGFASNYANLSLAQYNYEGAIAEQAQNYYAQKRAEMSEYVVNNSIAVPTVNFPYNSELIRDFYGNGIMVYRLKYGARDIARIDKLLTMYGYRHCKELEASDFTNRKYFNWVECANVTVTSHPAWFCDGIGAQLRNGVRVWHVLPDKAKYNNNPVRS